MTQRIRKKYNFKSVGEQAAPLEGVAVVEPESFERGIALRMPLEPAAGDFGSTFAVERDIQSVTRSNLKNLLATNWGERLGEYDFGANLIEFVAELETGLDPNVVAERVRTTVARWLEYINIEDVQILPEDEKDAGIASFNLRVLYTSPELFEGVDAVVVTLNYM